MMSDLNGASHFWQDMRVSVSALDLRSAQNDIWILSQHFAKKKRASQAARSGCQLQGQAEFCLLVSSIPILRLSWDCTGDTAVQVSFSA